jgi:PD-(D/E)XK nuclease superfamily
MSDEPIRVSNSEITMFLKCRRRWMLSYYQGWKSREPVVTGALALGSRVHAALEVYYKGKGPLIEQYDLLLDEDRLLAASIGQDLTTLESEGELGRLMLEGYLEWVAEEGIDSVYKVVGVEEILTYPMLGGRVQLVGKIDLRVQDLRDDVNLVLDHKTTAALGDFESWAHMNPQLMTYQMLDRLNRTGPDADERLAGGVFRLLKKVKRGVRAKPPFYHQHEVRHNVTTLRNFWTRTQGTVRDMVWVRDKLDAGENHRDVAYPTPTRDCRWWCPFFQVCPLMDDGTVEHPDTDVMFNDLYVKADPYSYYREPEVED